MAKLLFDLEALRPLVQHAIDAKERRLTSSLHGDHAAMKRILKEGVVLGPMDWPTKEQINFDQVPAHLVLVKDAGVYLMSPGLPALPGVETANKVVYARGYGPDADYDELRRVSGDDFSQHIDIGWFSKALAEGNKTMGLDLRANSFTLTAMKDPLGRERPHFSHYELRQAEALSMASAKAKWAEPGKVYKGAIFGTDSKVIFQRSGRGIVIHERALLPAQPGKSETVTISYPADQDATASLARGKARRRESGLTP